MRAKRVLSLDSSPRLNGPMPRRSVADMKADNDILRAKMCLF